jgi:hypothetical protein
VWKEPAAISIHAWPGGSAGTVHWPELLSPHAITEPSKQRATLWLCPDATCATKAPLGNPGTLHWPYPLYPHANAIPSLRHARVFDRLAEIPT